MKKNIEKEEGSVFSYSWSNTKSKNTWNTFYFVFFFIIYLFIRRFIQLFLLLFFLSLSLLIFDVVREAGNLAVLYYLFPVANVRDVQIEKLVCV